MSKKLLSYLLALVMLVTLIIPASAAMIETEPYEEIPPNNSSLTDPSIRDEGTDYPFLFSMRAEAVYDMLHTNNGSGKSFVLRPQTDIKTIRLSGTLYHSYANTSPNYRIKVGICYYDSSVSKHIPIVFTYVTSGVHFSAGQTILDITQINIPHVYTCYGLIKNDFPQGSTYVWGDVDFYYTTY